MADELINTQFAVCRDDSISAQENLKLRAECNRLRSALQEIASHARMDSWGGHTVRQPWYVKVAREALNAD